MTFNKISIFIYSITSFCWQVTSHADESTTRPNILFIVVDDQSPMDLRIYNRNSALDTPTLAALASRGVVIDNACHMGAWVGGVCTPSRHMIMSGRSVWHIPDKANRKSFNPNVSNPDLVPPDLDRTTMAAVFNNAGYITMRTCKNGNSYEAANRHFTIRKDATKRGGTPETGSAWHADQVLHFLNQRKTGAPNESKPFLIYFGFSHPHDVRDGTPELLEKYQAINHRDRNSVPPESDGQPPLPLNYLPKHPFHHGHPKLRDEVSVSGVWERRDPATIKNEIGRQFACSEYIDQQINRVISKLDQIGELDNTIIIYTSDHGMAIGRHGLQGKQNLYQHTWQVPFIAAGPGIHQGIRKRGNIYLMDILATLCDFTGIPIPDTNEGLSFKPVLTGDAHTVRDIQYGVYCGGTKPGMRCIRQGDWKLIKYDVMDGSVRKTQLFNLSENPLEWISDHHTLQVRQLTGIAPAPHQTDLSEDPEFQPVRKHLEELLLSEMERLHDPYRFWDQPGITPESIP